MSISKDFSEVKQKTNLQSDWTSFGTACSKFINGFANETLKKQLAHFDFKVSELCETLAFRVLIFRMSHAPFSTFEQKCVTAVKNRAGRCFEQVFAFRKVPKVCNRRQKSSAQVFRAGFCNPKSANSV